MVLLDVVVDDPLNGLGDLGVFGDHPSEHGGSSRQDFNLWIKVGTLRCYSKHHWGGSELGVSTDGVCNCVP